MSLPVLYGQAVEACLVSLVIMIVSLLNTTGNDEKQGSVYIEHFLCSMRFTWIISSNP